MLSLRKHGHVCRPLGDSRRGPDVRYAPRTRRSVAQESTSGNQVTQLAEGFWPEPIAYQPPSVKEVVESPLSSKASTLLSAPAVEGKERVFLVGVSQKGERTHTGFDIHESLKELGQLAETAGLQVMGSTYQFLDSPNMATYIGSGKVAEVAKAVRASAVDTVIFDDELSPGQLRNLEKGFSNSELSVRVCDRTALILDIFSQRAQTREGQLQVLLAQTEYQLPRLTRMWTHLDRVGGGGQVKGSGEKQIETDKRLLRDRIALLRRDLEAVRRHRRAYRERRQQTPIPVVALVGYTNAGKSTLMNALTQAGVLAEDKLFATLDPTTRRLQLASHTQVLLSDTVGFIQKLPTQLVAAFRATLEEIRDASLLLHVVDLSSPAALAQSKAVMQVLHEMGAEDMPLITAWNKVDACEDADAARALAASYPGTVCTSGRTGEGLEQLLQLISAKLQETMLEVQLLLPYSAGDVLSTVHSQGVIRSSEYTGEGTVVTAAVPPALLGLLQPYLTHPVDMPRLPASVAAAGDGIAGNLSSSEAWMEDLEWDGKSAEGSEADDETGEEDGWVQL